MDTVLLVLGILGFGAVVIAAYVFTVAARNYVSEHDSTPEAGDANPGINAFIERSLRDRRQAVVVRPEFPITVNGALIPEDRRQMPERRLAAA